MRYLFDGVAVFTGRREVQSPTGALHLRPKTFDLLVLLIRERHRVVSKQEILDALWPATSVSENSVSQCVIELRKALGDSASEPRWIRTQGKAGYRFVAEVDESPEPAAHRTLRRNFRWTRTVAAAACLAGLAWAAFHAREPITASAEASAVSMTASLPAARAYLRGVEEARQYRPAEAIRHLQEALRLDPGFVMARARIGYVYSVRWLWEEKGRLDLEAAYTERGRLNDRDRLYICAWYDQANHDYEGAIRNFRTLAAKFPHETEAREELGRLLLGEGQYAEARAELERVIQLDPAASQAHNTLSAVFVATHDFPRAIAEAKEFVRLQPGEMNAYDTLGLAYEAANDFAQAEKTYRWILERRPKFGSRIHLANTLYKLGRWREAKAEIARYIEDAPSEAERQWGFDQLGVVALRQQHPAEVLQYARKQPREGYHDQEIFLALRQGDLPRADLLLAARSPHADRGQRANRRLELRVRAERAMASRQTEVALDLFRHAAAERTPLYAIDWYEESLADAYLRLGRYPEAIDEYQRVLGIYPKLALAWYGLAKACEAAGQPGPARRAYQQMALLWPQADPDIIELSQARSFLAR